jgi:protein-L-isoaspartate(D-aspartate) O-methyltransferase
MEARSGQSVDERASLLAILRHVVFTFVLALVAVSSACRLNADEPNAANPEGAEQERRRREDPGRAPREHPAFDERIEERHALVRRHIAGADIRDPNVLRAMRTVPRHAFVPPSQEPYAYEDRPLPIGHAQTISQPYIVAFMTQALKLDPNSVVFEIGTGSGYQAAVAAEIAREVYSMEIVEPLAKSADETLAALGYQNVHVRHGDAFSGWPEAAPFDAIIGTAAATRIPPPLVEQLKPGGRMILPVGDTSYLQYLIVVTKDEEGRMERDKVLPVRFVPMTGQVREGTGDSSD